MWIVCHAVAVRNRHISGNLKHLHCFHIHLDNFAPGYFAVIKNEPAGIFVGTSSLQRVVFADGLPCGAGQFEWLGSGVDLIYDRFLADIAVA